MSTHTGPHFWHFSASEVTTFFKKAPRIASNQYFDALALSAARAYGRLIVVTPRRIAPAPVRNKIRRRLKELFRTMHDPLSLTCDLLVIVKPDALSLSFEKLSEHLKAMVQKANSLAQKNELVFRRRSTKKP